jgi:RNA polymerase sigma-70 factor, ECF subfamily
MRDTEDVAVMTVATAAPATVKPGAIDLARLKRREPMAWTLLFEREYPVVFRSLLSRVREPAVAEDIAAQVFLEAMEGIGRYRDRGKPITAWLLTIARHRALDWFRKARREQGTAIEPVGAGPEAELTVALDSLALLTDDQREVIHLRFVEGYSLEEVAALTNRNVGSIKSLQHRALARLRTVIGEQEGHRQ